MTSADVTDNSNELAFQTLPEITLAGDVEPDIPYKNDDISPDVVLLIDDDPDVLTSLRKA